tara:strand:+ start:50 stop:880 length:831 start_codon:yes stop_codon:yes gene_type:complete
MFSSEINLGSVRDVDDSSPFVRQALIGNENLKAASAKNFNLGLTYQTSFFNLNLDYWQIDFEDRIETENAQALLNENPSSLRITRNEDGNLIGVTTTYFNEEKTEISGLDLSIKSSKSFGKIGEIHYSIDASILEEFLTPNTDNTLMINRVGKFNYDNATHSLPKKRINTFLRWELSDIGVNINSRYIDGYINERDIKSSALSLGYSNKVKSSLMIDFSFSKKVRISSGDMEIKVSISNIFDKSAPKLYDAPDFSFDTRVHDPRGRIFGIGVEYYY